MRGNILLGVLLLLLSGSVSYWAYMENNLPANSLTTITSSSTSSTEEIVIKGSHEFKVTGYSLSKGVGIGEYIASESFSVGGHDWAIYYFPDGKSKHDNGTCVSLFIVLVSDTTDAKALFELTLLDQSGNGKHKVHSQFLNPPESGPYTLQTRGSMWGYKQFFKKADLETSDYLKDDCLYVNCSVSVVRTSTGGGYPN